MRILAIACCVIAFGSAVDVWCTVAYDLQPLEEYNPVARWILEKWDVAGLVAAKCFQTAVIVAGLWAGYKFWPLMTKAVAVAVAAAMAALTIWLWASS